MYRLLAPIPLQCVVCVWRVNELTPECDVGYVGSTIRRITHAWYSWWYTCLSYLWDTLNVKDCLVVSFQRVREALNSIKTEEIAHFDEALIQAFELLQKVRYPGLYPSNHYYIFLLLKNKLHSVLVWYIINNWFKYYSTNHVYLHRPNVFGF